MTPHRIWFRPDGTNVQIKLKPFSLVVSAGFGALTGADAVFLSCAYGAGLGVASLSVSYRSALSYQRSGHQALAYADNHPGLPLARR
jgi:hypothetical protein